MCNHRYVNVVTPVVNNGGQVVDPEKLIEELFKHVVEMKMEGRTDADIRQRLKNDGVPNKLASELVKKVNEEISIVQQKARSRHVLQTALIQLACLILCPLSVLGFVALKSSPHNLVPLNIGPINVVDSLLLTLLGTIALTTFFGFFTMFKAYFD